MNGQMPNMTSGRAMAKGQEGKDEHDRATSGRADGDKRK
jgi:hypothetical protein